MEYKRRAFFSEHEDDTVAGFAIIDANETSQQYLIAEKWTPTGNDTSIDSDEPRWTTYWVHEDALIERVENGDCSYKQQLNDKQFGGVCKLAGIPQKAEA